MRRLVYSDPIPVVNGGGSVAIHGSFVIDGYVLFGPRDLPLYESDFPSQYSVSSGDVFNFDLGTDAPGIEYVRLREWHSERGEIEPNRMTVLKKKRKRSKFRVDWALNGF